MAEDCLPPGLYEGLLWRKQSLESSKAAAEIDPNPANWIEDDEQQVKKSKLNIDFPPILWTNCI